MDDKTLADRVVALGVGRCVLDKYYVRSPDGDVAQTHEQRTIAGFVRDWRVAGALMEKCLCIEIDKIGNPWWTAVNCTAVPQPHKYHKAENESLPRAIIEACIEALASEEE